MKPSTRCLIIFAAVVLLWNTIIAQPVSLFLSNMYEYVEQLARALFAYANITNTGLVNCVLINIEYLANLALAVLILRLGNTKFKNYVMGVSAIFFVSSTIQHPSQFYPIIVSVIFAFAVIVFYMLNKQKLNDWVLDTLGISSMVYFAYDILINPILAWLRIDNEVLPSWFINDKNISSNTVELSAVTSLPAYLWSILWIIVSIIVVKLMLFRKRESKRIYGGSIGDYRRGPRRGRRA